MTWWTSPVMFVLLEWFEDILFALCDYTSYDSSFSFLILIGYLIRNKFATLNR